MLTKKLNGYTSYTSNLHAGCRQTNTLYSTTSAPGFLSEEKKQTFHSKIREMKTRRNAEHMNSPGPPRVLYYFNN